jgi:riboflavin synthase
MFTGLVEETGTVTNIEEAGEGKRIKLEADKVVKNVSKGQSISVSGACLTVEEFGQHFVSFFLAEETLEKTWFSELSEGDSLNLERSLKPEDRMGGHYVQGHIDTTTRIKDIEELEEGWNIKFTMPEKLSSYIVDKGFIALEGISLTIVDAEEDYFTVTIIPETWKMTNLSDQKTGDKVNIEADVMAKYAEKTLQQ